MDPLKFFKELGHLKAPLQRISKHYGYKHKKLMRLTKAYADDRQKAPHNRRKRGMRKRK